MITQAISIEFLKSENASLRKRIEHLEEQLAWLKQQFFGKRSEKIISDAHQLLIPGLDQLKQKNAEEEVKTIPAHTRKKPNRDGKDKITLPDNLPIERQIIDLTEEEKICPETGNPLVKIGEEITRKLAHRPGSYFIKELESAAKSFVNGFFELEKH